MFMETGLDTRSPRQDRSRATLERLLSAGEELLAEGGWAAVTVNEVCRRSGVSAGSFYARFSSRVDLVDAVGARLFGNLREVQDAAFSAVDVDASFPDVIRQAMHALAAMAQAHGATMARLLDDAVTQGQSRQTLSIAVDRYTEALLAHRGEITHPDPEYAVAFTMRVAFESLAFQTPANTPVALEHDAARHVDDLASMAHAYLCSRGSVVATSADADVSGSAELASST